MHRVQKFHGPERQVLRDISLSFLPGRQDRRAGAERRRASRRCCGSWPGLDEPSSGRAELAPGATVGLLSQEPQLDPAKDVRGNVEDGVAEKRDLLDRFNELSRAVRRADVRRRDDGAARGAGRGAGPDRAARRLEPRPRCSTSAMDALRLPARPTPTWPRCPAASGGGSRCAGCCSPRPTCCCWTSRPTTWTPSRSPGWSSSSSASPAPCWPSPTIATSWTTSPAGSSSSTAATASPSRATTRRGWSRRRRGWAVEEKQASARRRTLQRELEWVRMAPRARHAKSKARLERLRAAAGRGAGRQAGLGRDPHPGRRAAGRQGGRGEDLSQGLRRPAADRGSLASRCRPGGIVGVIGPERRRQDDAVSDDRRRGAARRRRAGDRRVGADRLRRPGAGRPRPGASRCGRRSRAARI